MIENRIFFYGTLLPGEAPSEIAGVVSALRPIGPGTIRGKLYHLDGYPGVVLEDGANDKVYGEVFDLPRDPEALARLDEYEGVSTARP